MEYSFKNKDLCAFGRSGISSTRQFIEQALLYTLRYASIVALVCWVMVTGSSPAFSASEPVEGLIEGKLFWSGRPVVGAQITSCADLRRYSQHLACKTPLVLRTDSHGRFSFRQVTGIRPPIKPYTREQIKQSPWLAVGDPGWGYWFRVDFEGMAAVYFNQGLGYGRTSVRFECDFGKFLADMKKEGIRPVANPGAMPFIDCVVDETALTYPRE